MATPKIKLKKPYQQKVMRRFTPEEDAILKADYAAYITRERVRQITSPHYIPKIDGGGKAGRPPGRPPKSATVELERLKNRAEWLEEQAKVVNARRKQIATAQLERSIRAPAARLEQHHPADPARIPESGGATAGQDACAN